MAAAQAITHQTVFAEAAVAALLAACPQPSPCQGTAAPAPLYVDATFGGGGHSRRLLRRLPAAARVLALDCDAVAAGQAQALLAYSGERFMFAHRNYSELSAVLSEYGLGRACGILFDLGISSFQLDDGARGFSFSREAALDMRMDNRCGVSAAEWLAQSSEADIYTALRRYGEEPEARRVARHLHAARGRLNTTTQLAQTVCVAKRRRAVPGHHPATRTFQAIRIAVNDELAHLQKGLAAARQALCEGGHLVVIAFHSLEDRLVKRLGAVAALPGIGRVASTDLQPVGRLRRPTPADIAANPRARSACLRVFVKVKTAGTDQSSSGFA